MPKVLTDFRTEFLDRLLDVLWRQWTALGVSGYSRHWTGSPVDPDALLLLSCTIGRYDARLFDAILEWLSINGRFISIQRIKRMLKDEIFDGEEVLRAVAAATSTTENEAKWKGITGLSKATGKRKKSLFFLKNGAPLPVVHEPEPIFSRYGFLRDSYEERSAAAPFRPEPHENLLLRLRALLGVNARAEIFEFLLLNDLGSPRAMARDTYYYPATITKALAEMSQSGFVVSRTEGRHRYYTLFPDTWRELFVGHSSKPPWVVWARLFSALEQVWLFLDQRDLATRPVLAQASSLRRILKGSVKTQLERSGPLGSFGDDSAYPGEALIPYFVAHVRKILDWAEAGAKEQATRVRRSSAG
ncbi:MAG TPA: winged helix-turn-helix domain-containing protein [Vicinamibacteria bacterium]|nr:winged helix-turn-helix domain-containing protein [Vicinamibacteria bacterium]